MLFLADSSQHPTSSHRPWQTGEHRLPVQPIRGPLVRLLLRLLHELGTEVQAALPVRVYYKFDSGCWRNRSTRQLRKVNRCR